MTSRIPLRPGLEAIKKHQELIPEQRKAVDSAMNARPFGDFWWFCGDKESELWGKTGRETGREKSGDLGKIRFS